MLLMLSTTTTSYDYKDNNYEDDDDDDDHGLCGDRFAYRVHLFDGDHNNNGGGDVVNSLFARSPRTYLN